MIFYAPFQQSENDFVERKLGIDVILKTKVSSLRRLFFSSFFGGFSGFTTDFIIDKKLKAEA
jgi:hypothetical protein